MSVVGQLERKTQDQVVQLFQGRLGYEYGGNWEYREGNSHVEIFLLEKNLRARGYNDNLINRAIDRLKKDASLGGGRNLYEANRDVYNLLRYGVKVKPGMGENTETVWLIDWKNPEANDFLVAEEVSIKGEHNKRPDIVLYVNGLALGVIELKRSKVGVAEGIRQNIGNQRRDFIRPFFTTVQLLFAGNNIEGLRYGVIETPEKYWLSWKEPSETEDPLDRGLLQMCRKERFLELIHDFIVFDSGSKKTCRHNQYFGVKAAQDRIAKREGGIIWHTQGSGKSLTMVWLAKWIREHQTQGSEQARVLIITDRTELDEQIKKVFNGVNEDIYRTDSGPDLIAALNKHEPWLIGSLVHKFRSGDDDQARDEASGAYIAELNAKIPAGFSAKGNLFIFVDEAHRTQSGKMHQAMKRLLPSAMFIGFTGTPLLKRDKATSMETFGTFIHTYKFDQAVDDGVVLDLRYEARNIDQELVSHTKIDQWFDSATKNMTDLSKAELKKRWGTMQKVISSEPRSKQIAMDIMFDMATKPRLMDGAGNAMLVGASIYQACQFYEMFSHTHLKGKVAIVTSYKPQPGDISKEDTGHGATEKIRQYNIYRQMLSEYFNAPADQAVTKVEQFEKEVKERFINEPGQMRLLIVVDKLLTGFDAPSATYLYIDKKMRDHGLFQAICRVNRLDGDDKDYGYIVDYQDLFNSLEDAITDYTQGAFEDYDEDDVKGIMKDRHVQGRKDLDDALERVRALCEAVLPPKQPQQYQHYFVATEVGNASQIKANEAKRVELYKSVAALTRAYAAIATDMDKAGYNDAQAASIAAEVKHYVDVVAEVKVGAGENEDFKQYEADMRFLLDTYIRADASQIVADFQDVGLVQLIVKEGVAALDKLPEGLKNDPEAMAEVIVNNIRQVIVDEQAMNPKYYETMSSLLDAIIEKRRQGALEYQEYLHELIAHAKAVGAEGTGNNYPAWAVDGAQRALVDFDFEDPNLAVQVDAAIRGGKPHDWVGNVMKEKVVKRAIQRVLPDSFDRFDELFDLVKARHEYR
ncbi:type I restriction endonuclease subunit R [Pseudarthrobacter sp. NPDC058119]|uniref:type I restriction endonuclease subunit R n=1 Tax=Pseudarthrobacter sp. NPDC058119 TaxID=3346348 RepID=UPI0036DBBB90